MTDKTQGPKKATPSIAIIGCGLGGIAAAVKLTKAGIGSFTIFERQSGPGGVWWQNRYPGLGVDVPMHLYSFSFKPHDWSRTHAMREELLGYAQEVIDDFGLAPHIHYNVTIERVEWDDDLHHYTLTFSDGATAVADVVISAVGLFHTAKYPTWPGLDSFDGQTIHTAHWADGYELEGKRIAVVGTGATSIQLVPALAKIAGHVYVFQREPGWAIARGDRDFTALERARNRRPWMARLNRLRMYWRFEKLIIGMRKIRPNKSKLQVVAEDYIDSILGEHPELKAAVTPRYPFPGKRPLFDAGFYRALTEPNVTLVPRAVERVTQTSVVDAAGEDWPIDVLVFATGFHVGDYLGTLDVRGRGGRSLHEFWEGEPTGFLGITVPGFPNFYMLYGPNTNGGGSLLVQVERQTEYAVKAIERMTKEGMTAIEPTSWAYRVWDEYLRWRNSKQVYAISNNYYKASSGKVLTEWPGTMTEYLFLTRYLGRICSATWTSHARPPLTGEAPGRRFANAGAIADEARTGAIADAPDHGDTALEGASDTR